jgi:hypothetical protein
MCIATNGKVAVPLSAQDMCFCGSKNGCKGGFPTTAWARIEEGGLVTGGQYHGLGPFGNSSGFCSAFSLPHCHHYGPVGSDPYPSEGSAGCPRVAQSPTCPTACDAGAKAPHQDFQNDKYSFKGRLEHYPTVPALMRAIMTAGPVETAFRVYADFENYAGGIYHKTSFHTLGGHAVKIVGWGTENATKYWKVANSCVAVLRSLAHSRLRHPQPTHNSPQPTAHAGSRSLRTGGTHSGESRATSASSAGRTSAGSSLAPSPVRATRRGAAQAFERLMDSSRRRKLEGSEEAGCR